MHELAITKSIAEVVLAKQREVGASRVVRVWIEAGEMRNLEPSWVQRYFDHCTEGTSAEGAQIIMERIPIVFRCEACGSDFGFDLHEHHDGRIVCPSCGCGEYDLVSGRELAITDMEVA